MLRQNFTNYRNELERFRLACERMTETNYVTSPPRITEVLRSIAESDLLYNFMSELTKRYDFFAAIEHARVPATLDEYRLRLPERRQEYIAFVFCLLVHIDLENINFSDFLSDYFFDIETGMNGAYKNFSETVVQKFKSLVMGIILEDTDAQDAGSVGQAAAGTADAQSFRDSGMTTSGERTAGAETAAEPEQARTTEVVEAVTVTPEGTESIFEQLKAFVSDIINRAGKSSELGLREKDEVMAVADAFSENLLKNDKNLNYALFLGLFHTVESHIPAAIDTVSGIRSVLAKNGMI